MEFEMQSPLEQLWSLLNFCPDEVFTSVGQVRASLHYAYEQMEIMQSNETGALVALDKLKRLIDFNRPDAQRQMNSINALAELVMTQQNQIKVCLERDILAMEVFLDVAAGSDHSLD
jgi:hypothetical protein